MIKEFLNMDCMELMRKMPDKCVDMVLTDIPYNLEHITNLVRQYTTDEWGNKVKAGRHQYISEEIVNGNINRLTFSLEDFLQEVFRITKGTIVIFCSIEQCGEIYHLIKTKTKNGSLRHGIYEKTNAVPINPDMNYLNNIENFVIYKFPKSTFNNHYISSVLKYPIMDGATRIHPTEKQHDLLRQLIEDNTNKGDIVFDCCMGSGSTCLVALQCGRQTIGCEIDKDIYEKALVRLQNEGVYQFDLLEDYK